MIIPAGHRVLVRPDKLEDTDPTLKRAKQAGIHLLEDREDMIRERAGVDKGVVLSIGSTAFRDFGGDAWCGVGDYIAYARHAGKWVKDPDTDEDVLVINDEDVICIIKKTSEKAD